MANNYGLSPTHAAKIVINDVFSSRFPRMVTANIDQGRHEFHVTEHNLSVGLYVRYYGHDIFNLSDGDHFNGFNSFGNGGKKKTITKGS